MIEEGQKSVPPRELHVRLREVEALRWMVIMKGMHMVQRSDGTTWRIR